MLLTPSGPDCYSLAALRLAALTWLVLLTSPAPTSKAASALETHLQLQMENALLLVLGGMSAGMARPSLPGSLE